MDKIVFVFGSNKLGRHGKGAALTALKEHGAIYGQGEGLQGQSYAIPTKDEGMKTLSLTKINESVKTFLVFAGNHSDMTFMVTRVGCGLAGLKNEDIAPMFKDAPSNVILPTAWGGSGFTW